MSQRDVLQGMAGSVETMTPKSPATGASELWTYRDIERRTGRPYATLRSDQAAARGRREAGEARATDMPAPRGPVKTRPTHHRRYSREIPGLNGELVFDSGEIREWCLLHDWPINDP